MNISAIEVCKRDLYTEREKLEELYPLATVEKVIRVRDIHQRLLSDPTASHREIVETISKAYGISESNAYSDLRIVKELLPALTESSKAFHIYRTNEMLMETYREAKKKGNLKVMADIAKTYGNFNRVGEGDDKSVEFDDIHPQPFVPTSDPRVLGIEPIPNVREEINRLLKKYRAETVDIEDVSYEEADLEEYRLFDSKKDPENGESEREDKD